MSDRMGLSGYAVLTRPTIRIADGELAIFPDTALVLIRETQPQE